MSPRAARAASLPFALLAIVLRLAVTFWLDPVSVRAASEAAGFLLAITGFVASAGLPLGAYLLLTRGARKLPAAFDIDAVERRFIAPATPRWFGPWVVFAGWLVGNLGVVTRGPEEDGLRPADIPDVVAFGAGVALLVWIAIIALDARPFLSLSPTGITDQRRVKQVTIGWDELVPGGPPPPATHNPMRLTVHTWTASTARSFTPRRLPSREWHVDPAFLAHTIRTYAEHSRRRAAIGTAAELARLQETFTPEAAPPTATDG